MAHNDVLVSAPPEAVFAVLSDPCAYADFVVGTKEIRGYDPSWPAEGSAIHWSVGVWRLLLKDDTVVVECEPVKMLHERIFMRPSMITDVRFELEPEGGGTRVGIDEYVVDGPLKFLAPAFDVVIWLRNHETLRRLKKLSEARAVEQPGVPTRVA